MRLASTILGIFPSPFGESKKISWEFVIKKFEMELFELREITVIRGVGMKISVKSRPASNPVLHNCGTIFVDRYTFRYKDFRG